MAISLATSELVALCVSTFLYGVFFTLVLITTVIMSYKATDDVRRLRRKILPVSYAMFVVATINVILTWIRGAYGFVGHKGGSPTAFFSEIQHPTNIIKLCCLRLQSVIGDGLIAWRLYVAYGRRFVVVIPALTLVTGYAVVGIVVIYNFSTAPADTDIFHVATPWIAASFTLMMITNIILSGAIALRIFLASKPLGSLRPHWPVIFVLIESCALYTFTVVAAFATFLAKSYIQYPAVDSIIPMVGIVFSLIVLQIRFHDSVSHGHRSHRSDGNGTQMIWNRPDSRHLPSGDEPKTTNQLRAVRVPMAVHVSKQIDTYVNSANVGGRDVSDSALVRDKLNPV